MENNHGLGLMAPRVVPALDPAFRPAVLCNHAFLDLARSTGGAVPVRLALEQADGSVFHFHTEVLPEQHPLAAGNLVYLERMLKFLLWSRGGHRIYFDGPKGLGEALGRYYQDTVTGMF